jgi:Flp pilus assembly protein CpaB
MIRLLLLLVALGAGFSAIMMYALRSDAPPEPIRSSTPIETSPEAQPRPAPVEREILVATTHLVAGTSLNEEFLDWALIPETLITDSMIERATQPDAISQIAGLITINYLDPGEAVRTDRLTETLQNVSNPVPSTVRVITRGVLDVVEITP